MVSTAVHFVLIARPHQIPIFSLDVPRPSDRLIKEKEFIEATSRLSSFNVMSRPGIPISPIEIRLTKDRLSLVSRVLSSNADAYKHAEVILDLAYKLGFRSDPVAEVKVLAMLADTALQVEDFTRAYDTSKRMTDAVMALRSSSIPGLEDPKVQAASEVCWVACFQLGRQPEFDDVQKKLSLLGRALELCPPDKLHDVLVAWRRLEKEDIEMRQERLVHRRSGTAATSAPKKQAPSSFDSLSTRLQGFRMTTSPLLKKPDAAALASRTLRSVAANFPFSVGGRSSAEGGHDDGGRAHKPDGVDVSAQASRVLSKGIGWLMGDDL
jgi:neuroblastoma-amplified sequence